MDIGRTTPDPRVNHLLGSLLPQDFEALLPQLDIVPLGTKTMLRELYQPITHA